MLTDAAAVAVVLAYSVVLTGWYLCCSWFRRRRGQQAAKDYWAIKDSWFAIDSNQLFCLLGPNGAGKVTAKSLLPVQLHVLGADPLCQMALSLKSRFTTGPLYLTRLKCKWF